MTTDFLHGLLSRRSQGIKHLAEPGPSGEQLRQMARAALRAPDHGELVPFRFRVVQGHEREVLGDLFAAHAAAIGKTPATADLERERAVRAPVTVAVIARIDPGHPQVPVHEQWMCVGGAVTNFLNAAHALGYSGKVLSGNKVRGPDIVRAFCNPGEQLVAWVAIGTGTREPHPAERDATDVLQPWRPGIASEASVAHASNAAVNRPTTSP